MHEATRTSRLFPAIIIIAVILRLLLVALLPMQSLTQMVHDDALFVNHAFFIAHGQWLGPYNQTTLIKGAGYPLFIAACSLSHLPLKVAEHGVYSAACIVMFVALRPVITSSRVRLILFLVLLFNPMMLDNNMNRALREGLYSAQTLLTLACAIGAAVRWQLPARRSWRWLVALGLSFSWFWITREEGAWMIPSIALLLLAAGVRAKRSRRAVSWIALCIVPVAILVATVNAVCFLNWRHYGVWETIELKSPEMNAAYGALCRVKPDHFDPLVPISRTMREQIYAHSAAFSELRPSLEGAAGRLWAALSATELPNLNGEIAGGWFVFALRDAVAAAGHARSATESREFYARLATEVNAACDSGLLPALPRRASLAPPWNNQYLPLIWHAALHGVIAVGRFEALDIDVGPSVGDAAALARFQEITHTTPTAVDPGNGGAQAATESDNPWIEVWQLIGVAYQLALPWLAGLAILVLLSQCVLFFKGYRSPLLIIELATLMLIGARVAIVSYLDVAFFPAINTRYLAPAYPLVLLFVASSLVDGFVVMVSLRAKRRVIRGATSIKS